jgi:hypothetical protein
MGSRAEHGSSMRMTSGWFGDGAGDAEALLLAAGEGEAALLELVLHFVPERGAAQAFSASS